jgi:hypothetical protein
MMSAHAETPIMHGPVDQRPIERRDDVLVYTGPVLEQDLEVTGPVELILYAASSALDTDFTAKLVDVYPDGRAMCITEGIIRARSRDPDREPALLEPGRSRSIACPTSNMFLRGHRLRLDVSSSNFPRFSRNLNTGEDVGTGTRMEVARQTVRHDRRYPSRLVLPVMRRSRSVHSLPYPNHLVVVPLQLVELLKTCERIRRGGASLKQKGRRVAALSIRGWNQRETGHGRCQHSTGLHHDPPPLAASTTRPPRRHGHEMIPSRGGSMKT